MKKITTLLLAVLLSACATIPEKPHVATAGSATELSSSQADSTRQSTGVSSAVEADTAGTVSQQEVPMPDSAPPKTDGALVLPETLAHKSEGWQVQALTPAQYDMTYYAERGGYRGFLSADVFFGAEGEKTTLFNANGKQISDANAFDKGQQYWETPSTGLLAVTKDARVGLVDPATGEVRVPFEYQVITQVSEAFYKAIGMDQSITLLSAADAKEVMTLERGTRIGYLGKAYFVVYRDNTLQIYRADGTPHKNIVCDDYSIVAQDNEEVGVNRIVVSKNGKWMLYDQDLKPLNATEYDAFYFSFMGDYIAFSQKGKWGVMDYSGKVTISPAWDEIMLYDYSASMRKGNLWTATMDISREVTAQPAYSFIGAYTKSGYACFEKDGKYGLVDDEGNIMMRPIQTGSITASPPGFDEDVFLIEGDNGPGSYGVMTGGQLVLPTETIVYPQGVGGYHKADEDYNLVCTPEGKWGYVDSRGQYVIAPQFEEADSFIEGFNVAMVSIGGKIALIDRKGKVVLETVFEDCTAFNPTTMVCAMRYRDEAGNAADCLVRLTPPQK